MCRTPTFLFSFSRKKSLTELTVIPVLALLPKTEFNLILILRKRYVLTSKLCKLQTTGFKYILTGGG